MPKLYFGGCGLKWSFRCDYQNKNPLCPLGVIAEKRFSVLPLKRPLYGSTVKIFSFLLENSLVPIYTENLKSVSAVVAEESLESDTHTHTDTQTLTCDIDPVPISIYFKFWIWNIKKKQKKKTFWPKNKERHYLSVRYTYPFLCSRDVISRQCHLHEVSDSRTCFLLDFIVSWHWKFTWTWIQYYCASFDVCTQIIFTWSVQMSEGENIQAIHL